MNRRNFICLAGGGIVLATSLTGCNASSAFPEDAVEAWRGPREESDPRRRAIAYAITAPNPHNRQPWVADLREQNVITIYCDRDRLLPDTDPFGRQILVGHGAFIEIIHLALCSQQIGHEITLWPNGPLAANLRDWDLSPVARIVLNGSKVESDSLFTQVLKRHTPKSKFDTSRPVAADVLGSLIVNSRNEKVGIVENTTSDATLVTSLRGICLDAAKVEIETPATMMESLRLTRIGPAEILANRDGISLNSYKARLAASTGMFDRTQPPAKGSGGYNQTLSFYDDNIASASAFYWLITNSNSRHDQIEAGRKYLRTQLRATALGIGMHPMSQCLQEFAEMKQFYKKVHQLLTGNPAYEFDALANNKTVQMLCRVGHATSNVPPTPRRKLSQFFVI